MVDPVTLVCGFLEMVTTQTLKTVASQVLIHALVLRNVEDLHLM